MTNGEGGASAAPLPLVLYVQPGCPFSATAVRRISSVLRDFKEFALQTKNLSEAKPAGHNVLTTPTLLLPDERRITGTPAEGRLRSVLHQLLGRKVRMPNKVWYLERNRLFAGVPLQEIEKYAHLFHEYDYKARDLVFAEGDLGDAIYLLKTGHVRLYRLTEDGKEITLAILGPGDVFGELALFEQTRRNTFAETLDAAHICAASVEDFSRLMAHRPQMTMMVARQIARRRDQAETRLAGLAYGSVRGRLTAALRQLAEEHGELLADGTTRINLRLSHQELAQIVGTSRESCTIELGNLTRQGALRLDDDHRFVLLDLGRLKPGAFDRIVHAIVKG